MAGGGGGEGGRAWGAGGGAWGWGGGGESDVKDVVAL